MSTTKINIGLALSRNYDKVSLEMVDEPITHETEEQLVEAIRKRFALIRAEIAREFANVQK
jgi:hypothetical protein